MERRQARTPPKVLIINLHSTMNAGDAAALEMTLALILRSFPQARITLDTNDPASFHNRCSCEVLSSLLSISRPVSEDDEAHWNLFRMALVVLESLWGACCFRLVKRPYPGFRTAGHDLLRAYMDADLVISCPGNIFATRGNVGLPLMVSLFSAAYALVLGKPLYVLPQTIGPFRRPWERWFTRHILAKADLVFAREPMSLRVLEEMGLVGPRYRLAPDVVFAFPGAGRVKANSVLRRYGVDVEQDRPLLGWTAINPFVKHIPRSSWEHYEEALSAVISAFVRNHGGKAVFFPQVTGPARIEDDRIVAQRIIGRMTIPSKDVVLIDDPLAADVLKTACGLMDVFVATRMHSGVFALSAGVPTLAVGYLSKTKGIMEMLGLDEWALEIDALEEEVLWATLESLWTEREGIRRHLCKTIPALAEQIDHLGELIAGDFYGRQDTRPCHSQRAGCR
jgi:colanic acid/amylovoran biosynthesis protein